MQAQLKPRSYVPRGTLRTRTACVDLDGVLAEYDGWRGHSHIGEPIPEGVELTERLHEQGFEIIIFSCRLNGQWPGVNYTDLRRAIKEWLDEHKVPYNKIATQIDGKPFADVYIDDRAVHFSRGDTGILAKVLHTASTGWAEEARP